MQRTLHSSDAARPSALSRWAALAALFSFLSFAEVCFAPLLCRCRCYAGVTWCVQVGCTPPPSDTPRQSSHRTRSNRSTRAPARSNRSKGKFHRMRRGVGTGNPLLTKCTAAALHSGEYDGIMKRTHTPWNARGTGMGGGMTGGTPAGECCCTL